MDEKQPCGHTNQEHCEEAHELGHLVEVVQMVQSPRVAVTISETGEIMFASSINPREAAAALEELAKRVRRYGSNFVRDHFDRGRAANWN